MSYFVVYTDVQGRKGEIEFPTSSGGYDIRDTAKQRATNLAAGFSAAGLTSHVEERPSASKFIVIGSNPENPADYSVQFIEATDEATAVELAAAESPHSGDFLALDAITFRDQLETFTRAT